MLSVIIEVGRFYCLNRQSSLKRPQENFYFFLNPNIEWVMGSPSMNHGPEAPEGVTFFRECHPFRPFPPLFTMFCMSHHAKKYVILLVSISSFQRCVISCICDMSSCQNKSISGLDPSHHESSQNMRVESIVTDTWNDNSMMCHDVSCAIWYLQQTPILLPPNNK